MLGQQCCHTTTSIVNVVACLTMPGWLVGWPSARVLVICLTWHSPVNVSLVYTPGMWRAMRWKRELYNSPIHAAIVLRYKLKLFSLLTCLKRNWWPNHRYFLAVCWLRETRQGVWRVLDGWYTTVCQRLQSMPVCLRAAIVCIAIMVPTSVL